MQALRQANIDVVVSMLENHEAVELGLKKERRAAERAGMVFEHFPIVITAFQKALNHFSSSSRFSNTISQMENELGFTVALVSDAPAL